MKLLSFIFLCLVLGSNGQTKAQSMSFQMNSFGNTEQMTVSSLSFQLDHLANCLYLGNGLAIYQPTLSSAPFQLECIIPISFDRNGLKIFPNPIGNHATIQFQQPSFSNTVFTIRIFNIEGKLVMEKTKNGFELATGTQLNTSNLFAGNYVIQVLSANSVDVIHVIKQD